MRDSGDEVRHPRKDRANNVCRQKTESPGHIFKRSPQRWLRAILLTSTKSFLSLNVFRLIMSPLQKVCMRAKELG